MKRIFITGDRSMDPMTAVNLVDLILQKIILETQGDFAVGTGNLNHGVERAVRYLVPEEAMNLATYELGDEGSILFEHVFKDLEPVTDEVIFIHTDPLASTIGKALAFTFPPEKIRMPLQEVATGL
jgi:hypothetical protein